MNPVEAALSMAAADLDERGTAWALINGLAVSARAEPRMTRDVDIAVGVAEDTEADALLFALQQRGYQVLSVVEQAATARLATARTVPPGHSGRGVVVDLLFASSGIEREIASDAERLEIVAGLQVPVARIGHLIATKVLARDDRKRPQDWDDLRALIAEASTGDMADARRLLALIERRGFHRGRVLEAALDALLLELGHAER